MTSGVISTIAGFGSGVGDGTAIIFNGLSNVAVNSNGDLFIAERYSNRIRKVSGAVDSEFSHDRYEQPFIRSTQSVCFPLMRGEAEVHIMEGTLQPPQQACRCRKEFVCLLLEMSSFPTAETMQCAG